MIVLRTSASRGGADHGWLKTKHSFSFAEYYDPAHMGFASLRVINEDYIAGGGGFPTHGHRDMEIVTYVVSGALEHKDSTGTSAVIRPGDVQRMSAGHGVEHSEFNHFKDQVTHILQIWIRPKIKGLNPSYEQKSFSQDLAKNDLVLVASSDGRDGSVRIVQDALIYACKSAAPGQKQVALASGRHAWLQLIAGELTINSMQLSAGDGAAISMEESLDLKWTPDSHFLLFELAEIGKN